jgi:hypothetical protein
VEDRPRGQHQQQLLRQGEPVARVQLTVDVDGQLVPYIFAHGVHRVVGRVPRDAGRQRPPQRLPHRIAEALLVVVVQEQQ